MGVWGSRSELNRLFGISNPDNQPQAELWMGADPNGSRLQPRPWTFNNAG